MDERDQDKIIHRAVRRIADDLGATVAEVNALLDRHPIEVDRDKYLKRVLALQLLQLDELEEAFHDKAIRRSRRAEWRASDKGTGKARDAFRFKSAAG